MDDPRPHPFALLVPPLAPWEEENLAHHLQQHGLQEPLTLYEHLLLDGNHRLKLCRRHNLPVRFTTFEGTREQALALVSARLTTRNLSQGQRAMVAAKMRRLRDEEWGTDTDPPPSKAEAANEMQVSETLVSYASCVVRQGSPQLRKAVDEGKVSLIDAYAIVDQAEPIQRRAVEAVRSGEFKSLQSAVEVIAPPPVLDDDETPVPETLQAVFWASPVFRQLLKDLKKTTERMEQAEGSAAAAVLRRKPGCKQYSTYLKAALRWAQEARPSKVCPDCPGKGSCKRCSGKGWLTVQEASGA